MLLVVDAGNTNTVIGLFDGDRLAHQWRIVTQKRTGDEIGILLLQLLAHAGVLPAAIRGVAACSVVPAVVRGIGDGVERYLGQALHVLDATRSLGFPVKVPAPALVGPDRVVNVIAARERLAAPFLVIDFGTATTFDCVDAAGAWVGGAIAPGLQIGAEALHARTARLPPVDLCAPAKVIGTDTASAMSSGVFWGYVGLVDGLARRCKAELGGGAKVSCVATGGLSAVIGAACDEIDEVDAHLTLHGLRLWLERGAR